MLRWCRGVEERIGGGVRFEEAVNAIEAGDASGLIELLEVEPALAKARGPDGDTLLHVACHHKSRACVALLLSTGAAVNARGHFGHTPLHAAVTDCAADEAWPLVEALLAAGANPALENRGGFEALAWARQEVWEPDEALFEALGATPAGAATGPPVLRIVGGPRTQVPFLEARAHTELAAFGVLEAWARGEPPAVTDTTQLPSADEEALQALRAQLSQLEQSAWEPLFRALARRATPADLRASVEAVLRAQGPL
jgi:hypothetical protein